MGPLKVGLSCKAGGFLQLERKSPGVFLSREGAALVRAVPEKEPRATVFEQVSGGRGTKWCAGRAMGRERRGPM